MKKLAQHIKSQVTISDKAMGVVLGKFSEKHYNKKEHLLHFDSISNYEFFVTSGCVRTYIIDYNGVEHNVFFSIENWWSGDLQSFINSTPATYSIQALENTTVLAISQENWKILINEVPEFLKYSRVLFRNAVIAQQNRIVQNLSFTAKERYQFFIEHYPNLVQRIAQKHIASYLGITPEFLSMLRNKKNR
jgi:CRP-like cAMP-binding protein